MLANRRGLLLAPRPTIFYDQFTDPNGTLLTSHKPAPVNRLGAWALNNGTGTATIQGNRLQLNPNGSGGGSGWWVDAKRSDVTVTAVLKFLASQDAGVVLRRQGAANYWLVDFFAGGTVTLFQDGATSKASGSVSFSLNTDYAIKAVFRKSLLSVYVNGVLAFAPFNTTTYQGATGVGLAIGGASTTNQIQWGNFKVTT